MLILPAFASSTVSNLPPCCRKNGKHQCAIQESQSSPVSAFSVIRAKCPCYPQVLSVSCQSDLGSPSIATAVFAGIIQHPALAPQAEAAARVSAVRSNQKRGPPFFLLS